MSICPFLDEYEVDLQSLASFGLILVSLFNDLSTFMGYLMPKPFLEKSCNGANSWRDKWVHSFLMGISKKGNAILFFLIFCFFFVFV